MTHDGKPPKHVECRKFKNVNGMRIMYERNEGYETFDFLIYLKPTFDGAWTIIDRRQAESLIEWMQNQLVKKEEQQ